MAFDLNKGGDDKSKFDLSKTSGSTSKFDLSKDKGGIPPNNNGKKKSTAWIFVLIGVVVLAIGAWYFTNKSDSSINETTAQTTPVSDNQTATPTPVETSNATNPTASNPDANTTASSTETPSNSSSTPTSSDNSTPSNNSTSSNNSNPSTKTGTKSSSTNVTASSLNNKVPAGFSSGSSAINSVDDKIVNDIISYLSKNPNSTLTVNGYASSEGDLGVNQSLSQKRANSFKEYLVSKGISSDKIIAAGNGIDNPISSNDTEEGRIKNRRVEILLQ